MPSGALPTSRQTGRHAFRPSLHLTLMGWWLFTLLPLLAGPRPAVYAITCCSGCSATRRDVRRRDVGRHPCHLCGRIPRRAYASTCALELSPRPAHLPPVVGRWAR